VKRFLHGRDADEPSSPRAGLEELPKPWNNLRASCVTDWADVLPAHVVCEFAGHSEAVSRAHYRQTTAEHVARLMKATQNPTYALPESTGFEPHPVPALCEKPTGKVQTAKKGYSREDSNLSDKKAGNVPCCPQHSAKNSAPGRIAAVLTVPSATDDHGAGEPSGPLDADLQRLLDVWPRLSPSDRQALADHAEALAAGRPGSRDRSPCLDDPDRSADSAADGENAAPGNAAPGNGRPTTAAIRRSILDRMFE
jgi:hypothetical protein